MMLKVLSENTAASEDFGCEHGLSLYVETGQHRLLFDTGASGLFAENADKLGASLSAVDIAVLSHGHYDHGGGLKTFLEKNERQRSMCRSGPLNRIIWGTVHCAHRGILNIVRQFTSDYGHFPDVVIGGFHLHSRGSGKSESPEAVDTLARELLQTGARYYTCHCTGQEAYQRLKAVMGNRIGYLSTGSRLAISL